MCVIYINLYIKISVKVEKNKSFIFYFLFKCLFLYFILPLLPACVLHGEKKSAGIEHCSAGCGMCAFPYLDLCSLRGEFK
jgi:hypothetical protein